MNDRIDGIAILIAFGCTIIFTALAIGFFCGAKWGMVFMAVVSLAVFSVLLSAYMGKPAEPRRRGRNG